MDSRLKPVKVIKEKGKVSKKYCDKHFKKNITKALKINYGEPDNIDKVRG